MVNDPAVSYYSIPPHNFSGRKSANLNRMIVYRQRKTIEESFKSYLIYNNKQLFRTNTLKSRENSIILNEWKGAIIN